MKVKICGITNIEDALTACKYGADMLGFVFYKKSSRYILPLDARKIISQLPKNIIPVGVFVNEKIDIVKKIVDVCSLGAVQFHGDENNYYCCDFKKLMKKIKVIKAFRFSRLGDVEVIKGYSVDFVLLDTPVFGKYGGTGKTFNWDLAVEAKKFCKTIILSGGLTPSNVKSAIKAVKPYAVDVSSGVQKKNRLKDPILLKKFIFNAKGND